MNKVLDGLNIHPSGVIVDGTLGGAGHAAEILKRLGPDGRLIAFDRDPEAVEEAEELIDDPRATFINANYADAPEHLVHMGIEAVDGVLLDLGLSSDQLADRDRGFSFQSDGPLDLRFNPLEGEAAWKIINRLGEKHLADIIYQYGEERLSRRIARKIVAWRQDTEIKAASHLARLVRSCYPPGKKGSLDPATRTFQALRIEVNDELKWVKVAMKRFPQILNPGGRLAVISFHSLEDRIAKQAIAENDMLENLTKRPTQASEEELEENPRSRSAKLRVAEKKSNSGI
jgi:16S rRNA (cytosine1402-N4)-methyltransferase